MGIANGAKGGEKLRIMQLHRLLEFEKAFSLYLDGKVPAARVTERAKKMIAVGLPNFK